MATIRIENRSDDDIVVTLDGAVFDLQNNESHTLEQQPKGRHTLTVHRKRIPRESLAPDAHPQGLEMLQKQDEKPNSHVQLDTTVVFDSLSSKTNITVTQHVAAYENVHEDVIFVGYRTEITGAKTLTCADRFANAGIRRQYLRQQLRSAYFPVGLVGTLLLLAGLLCLGLSLLGLSLRIGSTVLNFKSAWMLTAGGGIVFGFFLFTVRKIRSRARSLWQENIEDWRKQNG